VSENPHADMTVRNPDKAQILSASFTDSRRSPFDLLYKRAKRWRFLASGGMATILLFLAAHGR